MIPWQSLNEARIGAEEISHDACPCCGSPADRSTRYALYRPFIIVRCGICQFSFVGNPLSPEELAAHYINEFATQNTAAYHEMQRANARINTRHLQRYYRAITDGAPAGLTALDVGAGFGYLVANLQAIGFAATGIEPSTAQRDYARNTLGVMVTEDSLDDLITVGKKFDLITICDVIEHIVQPAELIEKCGRLIKRGGLLVIKTDNFDGLVPSMMGLHFYRQIPIEHVSLCSPETIALMASRHGLRVDRIITWTPGYSMRWAIKFQLRRLLKRKPVLLDPVAKNRAGPPMSLLGRVTNPVFRCLALPFDLAGRGVEFMMFCRQSAS